MRSLILLLLLSSCAEEERTETKTEILLEQDAGIHEPGPTPSPETLVVK